MQPQRHVVAGGIEAAIAFGCTCVGAGPRPDDAAARHRPVALFLGGCNAGIRHAERAGYPVVQQCRVILAVGGGKSVGEQIEADIGVSGDRAGSPRQL